VTDVWEMFRLIADERKRREVDPTITFLRSCLEEVATADSADPYVKQRLEGALNFLEAMSSLWDELRRVPSGALRSVAALRNKLKGLISPSS
jgi:DNA-binding transcriptional regulator GbsR (MarR family)